MQQQHYMTAEGQEVHSVLLSLGDLNRKHAEMVAQVQAEMQPMLDQIAIAQKHAQPLVELSQELQAQVQPMHDWVTDLESQVDQDYTRVVSRSAQLARGRKVYAELVRDVITRAKERGWSHVWLASMALEGDSAAIESLWRESEPDDVVLLLRWLVSALQRLEAIDLIAAVALRRAVRQLHAVSFSPVPALPECDPPVPRAVFVGSIDTNGPNPCTTDVPLIVGHSAGAAA